MKNLILLLFTTITLTHLQSQRKTINFPDIEGYTILKCDFHMHTVFSDGQVWPTYRVKEAWLNGLDAISLTEHIEYKPHEDDLNTAQDRSYEIARQWAQENNLLLVRGAEITRSMPPGHMNALFITNGDALNINDNPALAVEEANRQGAFIIWNHPGWKAQEPDGIPKFYDFHLEMIGKNWIHGIEYGNNKEYYPEVLGMAKEKQLSIFSNSDVHGVVSEIYNTEEDHHRPMTLVLVKERTEEGLKEALFAGRTIAWIKHILAGPQAYLKPFVENMLEISEPFYEYDKNKRLSVSNSGDQTLTLKRTDGIGAPKNITVEARSMVNISVPDSLSSASYRVVNTKTIETGEGVEITWNFN